MKSTVLNVKRGDRLPAFRVDVTTAAGDIDITDTVGLGTTVVLIVRSATDHAAAPIVNRAAATVTAVGTRTVTVERAWGAGETDTAGQYIAEIEFTVGGLAYTAPTVGYITVNILPDTDSASSGSTSSGA